MNPIYMHVYLSIPIGMEIILFLWFLFRFRTLLNCVPVEKELAWYNKCADVHKKVQFHCAKISEFNVSHYNIVILMYIMSP